MKKSLLTFIIALFALCSSNAQVAQPTHVVGNRINSNGEVTEELVSDFSYSDDGKLVYFEFPKFFISTNYGYDGDFLAIEQTYHYGGHPIFYEITNYTYENENIKMVDHFDGTESLYWLYNYYDDGRLKSKEEKYEFEEDYYRHWLYEYENDGKTKIELYYTSWPTQGEQLRKKTVFQYDENYNLVSEHIENFNDEGELTNTALISYSYIQSGMMETKTIQTLIDDDWTNISIMKYVYDANGAVIERLDGIWNVEYEEWDFDRRITFDTSENGLIYTVSFYKKCDNEWVWDIFDNQTILFDDNLRMQQRALDYMRYEEMCGAGLINQFVFTFIYTPEPVYLDIEERENLLCTIHPNPTNGMVTVAGTNLHQAVVVNSHGQRVATAQGGGEQLTVDISGLPAGIYFVNITDNEGRKCVRKVVKE